MSMCHMVVRLQHELGALETWRQQRGCSVRTHRSIKFPFILCPSSERCVFTDNNQTKTVCIRVVAVSSCESVLIDFIKLKSRTDGFLAWMVGLVLGGGQEELAVMDGGSGGIQRDAKINVELYWGPVKLLQDWRDALA